jgi:hypothetical protein
MIESSEEVGILPAAKRASWDSRWAWLSTRPTWQLAAGLAAGLLVCLWLLVAVSSCTTETATVLVTERVHGIADPTAVFDFGDLPRTAGIEHRLQIKNDGITDTLVMIVVTGEITDFITISDSTFSLRPGEERQVRMELKVPATAEIDKRYSGSARIVRLPYWNPF